MKYALFIIGVLLFLNGASSMTEEKTVMHQLYVALYIIGGAVVFAAGAVVEAVDSVGRKLKKQADAIEAIKKQGETKAGWDARSDAMLEQIESNTRR